MTISTFSLERQQGGGVVGLILTLGPFCLCEFSSGTLASSRVPETCMRGLMGSSRPSPCLSGSVRLFVALYWPGSSFSTHATLSAGLALKENGRLSHPYPLRLSECSRNQKNVLEKDEKKK